ncbi:NACHT domain-containing protein [Longimicrobium sp.]|jgi:DNA polymerase III delta prime subunit|uniref:NACHT domain-containing protein n=1 Tax=Longimicrobium sp. TaxID=2029185 RepID=UPI002EDB38F5
MEDYIGDVLRWSSRIQFFGMPEAEDTDTATVGLRLGAQPRRFRGSRHAGITLGETEILISSKHYVILGDPGSGKTTTLKRLARAVMLNESVADSDIYRHPVVVLLRDHASTLNPDCVVADVVGIPYHVRETKEGKPYYVSGKQQLRHRIVNFLNASNAILMLDGLDEIPEGTRRLYEKWASDLSFRLSESKILITSRTGDFSRHLDGFDILELCPLAPEQAREIAKRWLTNPDDFLFALRNLPYQDLADRPLLLSQLIVLYRREGALPEQPSHVYRRLLRLLLEDWDKERGIDRSSRYAGFDPDRKADFLAALSYRLSYRVNHSSFTLQDLVVVYGRIHRLFGLPESEATAVAEEIASHSGLINAAASGFEFSHLSFQEYLCACHLVRGPFPEHLESYVADRPGPLAVAVAISSSPGSWFAGLILKENSFRAFTRESFSSFFSRLQLERPIFDPSPELGFAVMRIYHEMGGDREIRRTLHFMFKDESVLESIARALQFYVVPSIEILGASEFLLNAEVQPPSRLDYTMPSRVSIPEEVLKEVFRLRQVNLRVIGTTQSHNLRIDEEGNLTIE